MSELEGKTAVVTGGGGGIGRAEALQLAALGAKVVVNDVAAAPAASTAAGGGDRGRAPAQGKDLRPAEAVARAIRDLGGEAEPNFDDVADWEGGRRLVRQAVEAYGSLDILVNNAGISRPKMVFNMTEDEWDSVVRVHLKGTFVPSRFAAEHWRGRAKSSGAPTGAVIVNTSSTNGLNGGTPGHVNYSTAKSGISTMTSALARELAPYGVRCNAVAPLAYSGMTRPLWGTELFPDERKPELEPDNVAAVVGWLASARSEPLSGRVLAVTGSTCQLWAGWRPEADVTTVGPWTFEDITAAGASLVAAADAGAPG